MVFAGVSSAASPIRLVNTGENLAANTVISKNSNYPFDVGVGSYTGHYHHVDLGASAPVVVASPTYAASKAFRYFIPGNATGGNASSYRSSLAFNEEWRSMEGWQGTEHWLGWAIRLDDDYPYPAPGYCVTMQFHSISWVAGNTQLSPVWAIRTRNDGQWAFTQDSPLVDPNKALGSYENDRGQWVEWVVNIKYDCSPNGFVRVWKNGQLVHEALNKETYNCEDINFGYYLPGLYNGYMTTNSAPDFGAVISDFRIADATGNFNTVSPSSYLAGAPAAPSSLTAAAVSSSQINLSWTDNAGNETGFKVDRAVNSSFSSGLVTDTNVAANATSYQSTGLAAGSTYYYRVRATNANGDSANSNTANATTLAGGGGGSIGFRSASSANSGSYVTSLAVPKPAGVVSGDFMLFGLSVEQDTQSVTAPAGWTLVRQISDSFRMWVYRKTAGASEPGSYTWTISQSSKMAAGIVAFTGVSSSAPIQVENGAAHTTAAATAHTTPTISTSGASTWLVSVFGDRNGTGSTWTAPTGATERVDTRAIGTSNPSVSIHTQGPVSAGNKSHTATASVSSAVAAMEIIALQPESGTGAPEINVTGNGVTIPNGDTSPQSVDYTDFGPADINTGTVQKDFNIQNTGTATLTLGTLTAGGDFGVLTPPPASIAAGGNASFTIAFNPTATGLRTATISFTTNDADENPFNYSIQGTGTSAPEINVTGSGITIADGDTSPQTADNTDFGSADITTGTIQKVFNIQNTGSGTLTLGTVTAGGDFTVISQPGTSIAAGGNANFSVAFNPSATGLRTATVSFTNGDANESPYDFSIQGTGSDTTPPTVSMTSPVDQATVAGTISVTADAADNVGVVGVQFKIDGNNLGAEDTTSPYSVSWDTTTVANGSHTLTAVARDAATNSTTSTAVNVTVSNSGGAQLWFEAESASGQSLFAPLTVQSDVNASGGQYISTTSSSTGSAPSTGHADFTCTLSGTVAIWVRVYMPGSSSDSFWTKWGGESFANFFYNQSYGAWAWVKWGERTAAGNDVFTVAYREANARLDRVLFTTNLAFTPTGTGGDKVWLQAEGASGQSLFSPLTVQSDANASGGQYISTTSSSTGSAPSNGHADFTCTLSGNVAIWVRVYMPGSSSDSFWTKWGGESFANFFYNQSYGAWAWVKWGERTVAGNDVFTIAYREANARLDRVLFTTDLAFAPTGMGP